jgi:hypothetical protein
MSIIDRFEFSEDKIWLRLTAVLAAVLVTASLIALIAYLMLSGTGVIKHTPPLTAYVEVTDQGFNPSLLAVKTNTEVNWVNKSAKPIRVQALPLKKGDKPVFDSGLTSIKPGETFTITVKKGVGVTIKYKDVLHPKHVGGISIVKVVYQ